MLQYVKRIPRPAGVLGWTIGAVALHALAPFELSRLDQRARRQVRVPTAARWAGLALVAGGASVMAWAFAPHYTEAQQGWELDSGFTPRYLLREGPYRLSRNPIYAGEIVVWAGWGLVYASPAVWAGLAVMCPALQAVVRWEERQLLDRFGDQYLAYQSEVPRWVPAVTPWTWRRPGTHE